MICGWFMISIFFIVYSISEKGLFSLYLFYILICFDLEILKFSSKLTGLLLSPDFIKKVKLMASRPWVNKASEVGDSAWNLPNQWPRILPEWVCLLLTEHDCSLHHVGGQSLIIWGWCFVVFHSFGLSLYYECTHTCMVYSFWELPIGYSWLLKPAFILTQKSFLSIQAHARQPVIEPYLEG